MDNDLPVLDQNSYVKETVLALWDNLPRILLYGLLFSLVSLPAVLIGLLGFVIPGIVLRVFSVGPGWTALCGAVTAAVMREPFSIAGYFKAFAHFYKRSLFLAALISLPLISAAWSLPSLAVPPVPTIVWVGLGADVTGLFFLTALYVYAYPLLTLHDVTARTALRNSLLLAIRYLSNTLGLIAMAGLLAWLTFAVHVILLLVLAPGWLVFAVNNCRMVLRIELAE